MSFGRPHVGIHALRAWAMPLALLALATPFACAESDEAPLEPEDAGSWTDTNTLLETPPLADGSTPEDAAPPPRCRAGDFCASPLPVQKPLLAVSGPSADDLWAVSSDAIVRWDGTSWNVAYQHGVSAPADMFQAIWAWKSDDVWVLGNRLVVRYSKRDGDSPVFREVPHSRAVTDNQFRTSWLSPTADALWAVVVPDVVRFREDSSGAVTVETMNPAVGAENALRYEWKGVWGFASNDVYVSGSACSATRCTVPYGALAHYDGVNWSIVYFPDRTGLDSKQAGLGGVYGTASADPSKQLWARVYSPAPGYLVFPVDNGGSLGEPRYVPMPGIGILCGGFTGIPIKTVESAFIASPSETWISTGCLVYRWNGTELTMVPTLADGIPFGPVNGVWANSAGDAWIVGQSVPQDPHFPNRRTGFAARYTEESVRTEEQP